MHVIAYAYQADIHCPACAAAAGMDGTDPIPTDAEGNEVGAVFSTDEHADGLYCGDCGECIEEPWPTESDADRGDDWADPDDRERFGSDYGTGGSDWEPYYPEY